MTGTTRGGGLLRPLMLVAALLTVVVVGVRWFRRDPRRLMLVPNGVMLVAAETRAQFFHDSAFVLERAPGADSAYPIMISAWFDERAPARSEAAIVRDIEALASQFPHARLTRVRGDVRLSPLALIEGKAWVSIAMDIWALGGYRVDITLHCPITPTNGGETHVRHVLGSTRGGTMGEGEASVLPVMLGIASEARCAEGEAGRVVGLTGIRATDAVAVTTQDTINRRARSDGDMRRSDSIAVRVASERSEGVARLTLAVDTLRLKVGESVNPDQALRLTALRADGSAMPRIVPVYAIADQSIAAMGVSGLRGVAAGITRATVRPLSRDGVEMAPGGVTASFVIQVVP